MDKYLQTTRMLDYEHDDIKELVAERGWRNKDEFQRILDIYNFVRDEIEFGYNSDDDIPASRVLTDGYGQCNTKATLFMALLRTVGIPCRIHGFTIDKELQKGAMTGFVYQLAPKDIVHSWVEIYFEGKWFNIEGFILDADYLKKLQSKFSERNEGFCGYGVATDDFKNPQVDWNRNDTYIQKEGINQDFGLYDSPDEFLRNHSQDLTPLKKWLYRNIGRKLMNRNVSRIRGKRD